MLNNLDHAELRVALEHGRAFGDFSNQMEIYPTEIEEAAREFPIVIRKSPDDGSYATVVLLGFDESENLFFEGDRWISRYVPAVQQRGPFSIGMSRGPDGEDAEPMIHIDLDDRRVRSDCGKEIFRSHGGNSTYLEGIADLLRTLYVGMRSAPALFEAWDREGLIEPVTLDVEVEEGRRFQVPDCHAVRAERLAQLDGQALERLNRSGHLAPAFFAASSLRNVARLIDLKLRRDA
nr:SapC family protein [Sphingomonas melonis]